MQKSLFPVSGGLMSGGSDMVILSEESSSYPDESDLELGLGLSLGGGGGGGKPAAAKNIKTTWDQYARILTAKDFPKVGCNKTSSSSSSSSSSVTRANNIVLNNGTCGTKRTAEPSSPPPRSAVSQVVGWPPVRSFRMNSLVNNVKSPVTEEFASNIDKCETKNAVDNTAKYEGNNTNNVAKKKSLFVKVNMDGIPIGRKIDLNAHNCYETLARSLDDMFRSSSPLGIKGTKAEEKAVRLLDGSSDFVITYEDKDEDWMLVGDVPWEMFLSSVRRLRIMRTNEAKGQLATNM